MKRLALLLPLVMLLVAGGNAWSAERTHTIQPEDYFTQVFLSGCVASPDGDYTAFVDYRWDKESDGRYRDIWVLENETGVMQRLTFDPGNEVSPQWSPDGERIYFIAHYERPGAQEPPYDGTAQVWRINTDGTGLMAVTRVAEGVYDYRLAADESALYYTRTKEHMIDEWSELRGEYRNQLQFGHGIHQVSELWKLDLGSWRSELLLDPARFIQSFDVAPAENTIALITTPDELLISNEGWSDVRLLDPASGDLVVLPDQLWRDEAPSPYGWLGDLTFSGDGNMLAFDVAFDGYPSELFVADLTNGISEVEPRKLPRPEGVSLTGGLAWTPGGEEIAFLGDHKARQRVYAVHAGDGSSRTLTEGDVVIDGFDFVGRRGALIAIQSTLTYYHDLVLYDRRGRSERMTRLNPQVDSWKLPQISIHKWTGADGDTVEGILELPPDYDGEGQLPLLVSLHGGPTASEKYCFLFWIYGRAAYAAKGYAMLSPNYRGSTGYGDEFLTDLIGHENDWDVQDILTGVDSLIEEGLVDPQRMGVTGWSNGGFLTNCLISTNRFKAASSGAGVLDMTVQLIEEDTPGHVINYMEGLPWEVPAEYQDASPIYSLREGIETAVLIHVGANDPRVPVTHSKGLHRMLHYYLDVPTELVIYPGAGHNLTKYTHRLAKVRWDHAWFDKYLLGE